MQPIIVNIAAATAVVGYDLFQNERMNVSSQPRMFSVVGMVGGAAIADTTVELFVESKLIGTFVNKAIGSAAVIFPDYYEPVGNIYVPAGSKISAIVRAQGGTNPTRMIVR